jgi:hypothetical protein
MNKQQTHMHLAYITCTLAKKVNQSSTLTITNPYPTPIRLHLLVDGTPERVDVDQGSKMINVDATEVCLTSMSKEMKLPIDEVVEFDTVDLNNTYWFYFRDFIEPTKLDPYYDQLQKLIGVNEKSEFFVDYYILRKLFDAEQKYGKRRPIRNDINAASQRLRENIKINEATSESKPSGDQRPQLMNSLDQHYAALIDLEANFRKLGYTLNYTVIRSDRMMVRTNCMNIP